MSVRTPGLTVQLAAARRLAVHAQRLDVGGVTPGPDEERILDLVRHLGCLQLDPIAVVARNPLLVLHSRLGDYDVAALERLLWERRALFEYWAHAASIVPTEDFPIHHLRMRTYVRGGSSTHDRVRDWMSANRSLRLHILAQLRRNGPLPASAFEDRSVVPWSSTGGWNDGRNVGRMLDHLLNQGKVLVAGRDGGGRLWDLPQRVLPDADRSGLRVRETVRRAARRSLRGLGIARERDIASNFTPGRFPGLREVLQEFLRSGEIVAVDLADGPPGPWYVRADDLERLREPEGASRTALLSPFDNLIRDRDRLEDLFGLYHRLEIYTPKAKRRWGYFAMPILYRDRFVGRVDPRFDRDREVLVIESLHREPGAPTDRATTRAVRGAIEGLAAWVGARGVEHVGATPGGWAAVAR